MSGFIVDQKKCIGCNLCSMLASKNFSVGKNGKSVVKQSICTSKKTIDEIILSCPSKAITYKGVK